MTLVSNHSDEIYLKIGSIKASCKSIVLAAKNHYEANQPLFKAKGAAAKVFREALAKRLEEVAKISESEGGKTNEQFKAELDRLIVKVTRFQATIKNIEAVSGCFEQLQASLSVFLPLPGAEVYKMHHNSPVNKLQQTIETNMSAIRIYKTDIDAIKLLMQRNVALIESYKDKFREIVQPPSSGLTLLNDGIGSGETPETQLSPESIVPLFTLKTNNSTGSMLILDGGQNPYSLAGQLSSDPPVVSSSSSSLSSSSSSSSSDFMSPSTPFSVGQQVRSNIQERLEEFRTSNQMQRLQSADSSLSQEMGGVDLEPESPHDDTSLGSAARSLQKLREADECVRGDGDQSPAEGLSLTFNPQVPTLKLPEPRSGAGSSSQKEAFTLPALTASFSSELSLPIQLPSASGPGVFETENGASDPSSSSSSTDSRAGSLDNSTLTLTVDLLSGTPGTKTPPLSTPSSGEFRPKAGPTTNGKKRGYQLLDIGGDKTTEVAKKTNRGCWPFNSSCIDRRQYVVMDEEGSK